VLLFKANLLVGWKQRLCQLVENGDFYVFNRVQKEAVRCVRACFFPILFLLLGASLDRTRSRRASCP